MQKILNKTRPLVSKCCKAELKTYWGEEGTNYFECKKCGQPTDSVNGLFTEENVRECAEETNVEQRKTVGTTKTYEQGFEDGQKSYRGISNWKNEGEKFGYFEFFKKEIKKEIITRIKQGVICSQCGKSKEAGLSDWCADCLENK